MTVAYFSMGFAIDDRLPIYAGGLGERYYAPASKGGRRPRTS